MDNTNATNHDRRETSGRRGAVQRRLEALIRQNRFTIAVVFPVVGAVTLVASAEGWLPEPLAYNPLFILFGTAVMRSPLLVGVLPRIGWWALGCLGVLTAYTYAIEVVGVRTDWPYGAFEYTIQLGPMLLGEVPIALPLFFIPLVLNAYLLTLLVLGDWSDRLLVRVPVAIAAVVAIDVVLDPAAVAIGFWAFESGGFYGVPLSNYAGWVLSGTVAVALVDLAFERSGLLERVRVCEFMLDDLVSFVLLWGSINLLYGNWLAAGVAGLFCLGLFSTDRYDREMVLTALPRFDPDPSSGPRN
ncbi:bisanhydrobacterioruberin hydratase [Natronobacterium gregoryi]|uniref:Carotene biosynthesis associated membrane protein n=2 Tax=Natronobacterium gregoryi TaxID=44930 RepID=L0AJZ2_NATGS|nr:bisanhydrobacterioruberin hydratase [Natronobacterium gregoryi]AFZ73380.1 carotene biosynthesis associated membrane protein [Natronobacterium gregoryi SP2]ELY68576.1 carotene biosynthesis associated membrane protein [Natronobacterium gregoryi SP2]PLK19661.1 carotene biosynthesis protein [Natronobacterium gregoryi SP2]SFI73638.1 putative membrane protein [Natronobacterium gregoryi]